MPIIWMLFVLWSGVIITAQDDNSTQCSDPAVQGARVVFMS